MAADILVERIAVRPYLRGAGRWLTVLVFLAAAGCNGDDRQAGQSPRDGQATGGTLRVFMADSLARPFAALGEAFKTANPGVRLVQIPAGSVLSTRKLTHGNDQADVLAVADYMVLDELLRPAGLGDWYICFATNTIVIAHTDMSAGGAQLTADNWFDVLAEPQTKVQAANPYHDPCGYWTELSWKLADLHYPATAGGGSIWQKMTDKCGPAKDRRSDSQELLRLVETAGGIDYAFVYRSQAMLHNLPFLALPAQINMGDPAHVDFYRQVSIQLPGKASGQTIDKRGDAIVFAVTMPRTVKPDREKLALGYIAFMLSDKGQAVLTEQYLTMFDKPFTFDLANVPEPLRHGLATRSRPDAGS